MAEVGNRLYVRDVPEREPDVSPCAEKPLALGPGRTASWLIIFIDVRGSIRPPLINSAREPKALIFLGCEIEDGGCLRPLLRANS